MEQYKESVNVSKEVVTRISSLFLNKFSKDDTVPLLEREIPNTESKQSKVLEVILSKIPIPDDNIPWEKIIDYRKDPDTKKKFTALRVWIQDISRKDYTQNEISDRIDYLINEYEQHLKLHSLKYSHGSIRVFVTTLSDIIENLATLKFSKIAETLFSLREKNISLLEAELQAPGREIAYLSKAKNLII